MLLSVVIVFLVTSGSSVLAKQRDCAYQIADNSTQENAPCTGTDYSLARSVDCVDGPTVNICCSGPYRQDIQKSRQNFFDVTIRTIELASTESCTKRILCEQACLDGLEGGPAKSFYPKVIDRYSETQATYVASFIEGERISCFGQNPARGSFSKSDCRSACSAQFPSCETEMKQSPRVYLFYLLTRLGHKSIMASFGLYWCVRDALGVNQSNTSDVGALISATVEGLVKRMKQLEESYSNSMFAGNWKTFLLAYRLKDNDLVQHVAQHQTFQEFKKTRNQIKEIFNLQ